MAEEKECFIIAPIGEPESDIRKRSDQILKHIIVPAAENCGYKAVRADQISEPGIITSQVIQHTVESPLVIADLTGRNPNVFYELAIRHAIKKPLVQIIKKGETIPFDIAGTRTIQVDHHDLDSVEEAKSEITKQIKAVEKDVKEIDTPISVALNLQILRQSDNPEQRSLGELVSAISELRAKLVSIEKGVDENAKASMQYIAHLIKTPVYRPTIETRENLDRLRQQIADLRNIIREQPPSKKKDALLSEISGLVIEEINREYYKTCDKGPLF